MLHGARWNKDIMSKCGVRYRFGALTIYQDIYGNTTVIPKPGSRKVPIYGFPTISRERDLSTPAIWPFPSKDEDRIPAPISVAALNCPTCDQPLQREKRHPMKGEPQLEDSTSLVSHRSRMGSDQNQNDFVARQVHSPGAHVNHSSMFRPHLVSDQSHAAPRESCSYGVLLQKANGFSPNGRSDQNDSPQPPQQPSGEDVPGNEPMHIETFSDDDSVYNVLPNDDATTFHPKPVQSITVEKNAVADTVALENDGNKASNPPPAAERENQGTNGSGKAIVAKDLLKDDSDPVYEVTDWGKPIVQEVHAENGCPIWHHQVRDCGYLQCLGIVCGDL